MTHGPPGPPSGGGTPFGQYRLIALIGRGGMGEVWRAHDIVTDRIVALKLLPAHFAQDTVFKERFRREAHVAAQLNSRMWCRFTPTGRSTDTYSWTCG